jgi:hypothetical protein
MMSPKFTTQSDAFERHFSCRTVSELWGVDESTVVRLFQDEPGVFKIKRNAKGKRSYTTYRIPESVMHRVHGRMTE